MSRTGPYDLAYLERQVGAVTRRGLYQSVAAVEGFVLNAEGDRLPPTDVEAIVAKVEPEPSRRAMQLRLGLGFARLLPNWERTSELEDLLRYDKASRRSRLDALRRDIALTLAAGAMRLGDNVGSESQTD